MATPINLDQKALLTTDFGLALAAGRLKATITDSEGEHLTITFKSWKRGVRGRVPIHEAERIYVEVPNQSGWGDKIGNIDVATNSFWQDGGADPYRVAQAMKILDAAQGLPVADKIQHPGSCMICGHELTDPVSIKRGIGPDCYGAATNSIHQEKIKNSHQAAPAKVVKVVDGEPHIKVGTDGSYRIFFQSKFSREIVNIFKEVTDQKGRNYDSHNQFWWITPTGHNARALLELAKRYDLTIDAASLPRLTTAAQDIAPEFTIETDDEGDLCVAFDFGPRFQQILGEVKDIKTPRRYDPVGKFWRVEATPQAAVKLYEMCQTFRYKVSEEAVAILKPLRDKAEYEAKHSDLRASLSKAEDADIELGDFGFEPFPFQRAGIMYGEYCNDRYMIADEQGLGKTIQALGRIQRKEAFPAVIVVPSAVKIKWAREAKRAFNGDRKIQILEGQKPSKIDADIVIVNYDILSYWSGQIIAMNPQALIMDESHYIKNRKAQRTIAAKAVAKAIPDDGLVLLLTGTPILNRPIELIEQLDVMGRLNDFGGSSGFITRYVGWTDNPNPRKGGQVPAENGAKNLPELNEKLRSTCFVRRLKKDVLTELPEKQRDVVPITIDKKAYRKAYEKARQNIMNSTGTAEHLAEIQYLRRAAVEGKLNGVIEWITDFLESGEKLVVFAHHRDVQQRIHEAFPGSVRIAGKSDQSQKARQQAMDDFQADPNVKLAVVSMTAGREGIDLYAASNLAFVELGWNPGVHDQAEDRIHRIGQDRGTMMYYLLAEDTIDEEMAALIEKKRKMKDAATEGQDFLDEPDETMLASLVKWLTKEEEV